MASSHRTPIFPTTLVVLIVGLIGALAFQSVARPPASLAASSPTTVVSSALPVSAPPVAALSAHAALGEADGAVPAGVTVFDDRFPAVANLDPSLLGALREAANDAARDGVTFSVTSGWRSSAYQEQLLRDAVSKYGSKEEAARWVATPTTSEHVSGDAVDVGAAAAAWLSRHGAEHGLCQIYRNETWHYELRADAIDHGCPAMYADPTKDPRMHR
jgi:hypothetical protein